MFQPEIALKPLKYWTITETTDRPPHRCQWLDFRISRYFSKEDVFKSYATLNKNDFYLEEGVFDCGYFKSELDGCYSGIFNFVSGLRLAGSTRCNDDGKVKTILYYTSDENYDALKRRIDLGRNIIEVDQFFN